LRIIFTPEGFNQRYGGVSRVFAELAFRLNQSGHDARIIGGLYINDYIDGMQAVVGYRVPDFGKIRSLVNTALCAVSIALWKGALVHQTYYSQHYYQRSHPLVLTVFDMTHEIYADLFAAYPDHLQQSRNKARCCLRANHICAISHHTKNDLIRILGVPEEKVSVTYLGNPLAEVAPEEIIPPENKKYLLHVGGRGFYKNFPKLLQAFRASEILMRSYRLVCFGGGAFAEEEIALISKLGLIRHVLYRTGGDQLLAGYYQKAAAHVSVSLYEGFGLTLVEAMGLRCPVICSDRASLPEVAGEAASYFNPEDPEDIRNTLEQTLSSQATLDQLVQAGAQRAKLFTWEHCLAATLSAYGKVA